MQQELICSKGHPLKEEQAGIVIAGLVITEHLEEIFQIVGHDPLGE